MMLFLLVLQCRSSLTPRLLLLLLLPERATVVVKALCYKPEGHGFEARSGFFLTLLLAIRITQIL
jgi:hypothetical protein